MSEHNLEIDAGYLFRDRYPERDSVYAEFDAKSEAARRQANCVTNLPYGNHPREKFDLFLNSQRESTVVVFFHGGYWQSLDRSRYSFIGQRLSADGFHVALPSYPLCPEVSFRELLKRADACIPAIFETLRSKGCYSERWIVSGHSAGGHIAANIASRPTSPVVPYLVGCLPVSGIFDLEPVSLTGLNAALSLGNEEIVELSPVRNPAPKCSVLTIVGSAETEEFINQSEIYYRYLKSCGGDCSFRIVADLNHYTILGNLLHKESVIAANFVTLEKNTNKCQVS